MIDLKADKQLLKKKIMNLKHPQVIPTNIPVLSDDFFTSLK